MTISKVYFASRELAESLIGKPSMAVISITDPGTPEANLHAHFEHVLRLAFYDALPDLHNAPDEVSMLVHCEYGVSRSAAVALFVEAWSGAPLISREFTGEANQWVVDQLSQLRPELDIDIPPANAACDRRSRPRPA